jgi:anti-sigma factor RsiW
VSDVTEQLSPEEMADLCALADGTLPAERRAEVEARVAASPELEELLERQRQAVLATQTLEAVEAPESLQAAVEARLRAAGSKRASSRFAPRIALAGAAAIAVAIVAAIVLSGGPGAPTVADAARLAGKPPNGPAPLRLHDSTTKLAVRVDGVAFPYLAGWAGWHALGVHRGRVDGRDAVVVFYGKDGRRIAYVIVDGAGLPRPSGAQSTKRGGVEYQTLRLNGRLTVTWRRGGHTCVLIGQAPRGELLTLASWQLNPPR